MTKIAVKVDGLDAIVRKLNGNVLYAGPLRTALTKSAMAIETGAKQLVPVDTHHLQRSITHHVDPSPVPLYAEVGTNVKYAPMVHEGRRAGRAPRTEYLVGWAKRHGYTGSLFVLARSIGRRGTPARPTFERAISKVLQAIPRLEREASIEIESAWNKVP